MGLKLTESSQCDDSPRGKESRIAKEGAEDSRVDATRFSPRESQTIEYVQQTAC